MKRMSDTSSITSATTRSVVGLQSCQNAPNCSGAPTVEPDLKGWLHKWTNYLKGYQKRWFILTNGKLSYYRAPSDISQSCRGSLNLVSAVIHTEDSCNFVVASGQQTYHLKAASENERQKWVSALELVKARTIRQLDAEEEDMYEMATDRDEMQSMLRTIDDKLDSLKQCTDVVLKHGTMLQRALSELEQTENPSEAINKIKAINERATLYRITSSAMINASSEYYITAQEHSKKLQKSLAHEREARVKLEELVEQLAKQHSSLEQRAIQQQWNNTQPGGSDTTTTTVSGSLAGNTSSNVCEGLETEDDEFYDAEENTSNTDFFVTFPGKAHRVPTNGSDKLAMMLRSAAAAAAVGDNGDTSKDVVVEGKMSSATATTSTSAKQISDVKNRKNKLQTEDSANDSGNSQEDEYDEDENSSSENIHIDVEVRSRKSLNTSLDNTSSKRQHQPQHHQQQQQHTVTSTSSDSTDRAPVIGSSSVVQKHSDNMSMSNGTKDEQNDTADKQLVKKRRNAIPLRPNHSLNLWSILKNCIGKELTKIPMPVNFNEPISMLQRMVEEFEYAHLLHKAAQIEDPLEQMVYVAVFSVTCYASTSTRTTKPFNPLLGETYECDRMDDLGWRCISEQVSHHPPMLAQYCDSKTWNCWREFSMNSKFRGKYLSIIPVDITHLEFPGSGNHYTWKKVTTTVNNIIVGKLWVDHHGEMQITNHKTGDVCHLNFHQYSYFSRDIPRKVTGLVVNKAGEIKWVLQGTWDAKMDAAKVLNSNQKLVKGAKPMVETGTLKTIWKRAYPPAENDKMYNFTQLAIQLNEMEDGVAPTDSRLRPDQRLMEVGRWDEANERKLHLEEKQRQVRREREESSEKSAAEGRPYVPYEPIWFKRSKDPITGNPVHMYTDEYWQSKQKNEWSKCPNIYD